LNIKSDPIGKGKTIIGQKKTVWPYHYNSHLDLSKGSFDLSILVTDSLDLGVVARKIATTRLCTYASPVYLAEYGKPENIDQLNDVC
jgi:hypothetical protein